ncbi:unnamed protein product [Pleuronectes platessa]|uniref:Uncharacterized protein n=1 Tax=Pleuronectes platessa TaxID=8262 RepID=A0A9N7YRX7_PLEPL|nr:unnamed protein product [Pleuronectes platessa]
MMVDFYTAILKVHILTHPFRYHVGLLPPLPQGKGRPAADHFPSAERSSAVTCCRLSLDPVQLRTSKKERGKDQSLTFPIYRRCSWRQPGSSSAVQRRKGSLLPASLEVMADNLLFLSQDMENGRGMCLSRHDKLEQCREH